MIIVVWSLDGTPMYALARQLYQHAVDVPLHTVVAHLDLSTLGTTLVLLCSLLGTSRAGRTTIAIPVSEKSTKAVEVVFVRGSLCMVGLVLRGASASLTDSVLEHPKLPLALLALSVLEPPCRPESQPQQRVGNPLSGPTARPAKTTPTNHLATGPGGAGVDTPGAPMKRERSGSLMDEAAEPNGIISPETVADAFGGDTNHDTSTLAASTYEPPPPRHGRWCAVVQELLARRDEDRRDVVRRQTFTGKEVLREVSAAPTTALSMQAMSEASELHQTVCGLVDWWTGIATDCQRSIWLIVTDESPSAASRKAVGSRPTTHRREDTIYAYGYEPFPSLVIPTWTRTPLAPITATPSVLPSGATEQPVCFPSALSWTRAETHVLTTVVDSWRSERRFSVVMTASGKAAPSARKLEAAVAHWNALVDCATSWV